jgi:predicted phosphodiesterase
MRFLNFLGRSNLTRQAMLVSFAAITVIGLPYSDRLSAAAQSAATSGTAKLTLPLKPNSVRFAMIGDMGTGKRPQFELAEQMARYRESFPFEFVITLGDNIYGDQSAAGLSAKFEDPYKSFLDAGVKFYAALGNHDNPNQRFYKPFNMGGKRYYTFKKGKVEFFVLDSNYMDKEQTAWVENQLKGSNSPWKICYFHHPLYSHGRTHGSDTDLRNILEPLFEKYDVRVVFAGHDHVYERLKPQHGINYFVLGSSGQLRPKNLSFSQETAKGFDTDLTFGLVEVADDDLFYQIVSRTGQTVDSGVIQRPSKSSQGLSPLISPIRIPALAD